MAKSKKTTRRSSSREEETAQATESLIYEDKWIRITADALQYTLTDKRCNQNWYFSRIESLATSLIDMLVKEEQRRLKEFIINLDDVKNHALMVLSSLKLGDNDGYRKAN